MFKNLKKVINNGPNVSPYQASQQKYSHNPIHNPIPMNNTYEDRTSIASSKPSSVFPAGYVPPHIARSRQEDP